MDQIQFSDTLIPFPLKDFIKRHVIANVVLACITIGVVAARFAARTWLGGGLWLDDWLILVSAILALGAMVVVGMLSWAGAGYDVNDVLINLQVIYKLIFATVPLYLFSLTFTKASMLCFYLRIFQTRRMQVATKAMLGVIGIWGVAHFMANVFICRPVAYQFDLSVAGGECGNQISLFQSMVVTNIITDLVIMALPMHTLWNLQIRRTEKIGVMSCFLLLLAVVVTGTVRITYISTTEMRANVTGTMPTSIFLTVLELNLAILCVSIPMLRPFYKRYREQSKASGLGESYNMHKSGSDYNNRKMRSGSGPMNPTSNNHNSKRRRSVTELDLDLYNGKETSPSIETKGSTVCLTHGGRQSTTKFIMVQR